MKSTEGLTCVQPQVYKFSRKGDIGMSMKVDSLYIPPIQNGEKRISDTIIILLTLEWPLSIKGLFTRLKRQYSKTVSYQGVHKAVKRLEKDEVLVRKDSYYKLNKSWLAKIEDFTKSVNSKYGELEVNLKGLP